MSYTLAVNVENLALTGKALNATGNAAANTLTGNASNNTLKGLSGNDNLSGGNGADKLFGGLGKDTLTGGLGKDIFVFDTALSSSNVDTIKDFSVADDKIHLDKTIFKALNLGGLSADAFAKGAGLISAQDSSDRIIYNTSNGNLFYDADGNGSAAAAVLVGILSPIAGMQPDLIAASFMVIA